MKVKALRNIKVGRTYIKKNSIHSVVDHDEEHDVVVIIGQPYAIRKKFFEVLEPTIEVADPGLLKDVAICTAGREGACWFAKGETCRCACGGRNHGIAIEFETFVDAQREYLDRFNDAIDKRSDNATS